ncbi:hypothetical protein DITRI_Ditri15bG0073400 [Diplodiscus trichospermus]
MDAGLGNNPSSTWHNIWRAKEVLDRGLRWRVGNGESIRTWYDKWLPTVTPRPAGQACDNRRVPMNYAWLAYT